MLSHASAFRTTASTCSARGYVPDIGVPPAFPSPLIPRRVVGAGAGLLRRPRVDLPAAPDAAWPACPAGLPPRHQAAARRGIGGPLRRQPVLVERVPLVVEDPVERGQVGIRIEPGFHMQGLMSVLLDRHKTGLPPATRKA